MSRTAKGTKGPGYEYWASRLHRYGERPGRFTKTLTHRKERRETRAVERVEGDAWSRTGRIRITTIASPSSRSESMTIADTLTLTDVHGRTDLTRQPDGTWTGATSAWHARLATFADLKPGWNGYEAPPPSALAIANAGAFLDAMLRLGCEPTRVSPSAVGGVAITRRHGAAQAYFEFRNTGSRLLMLTDDDKPEREPIILPFGADSIATTGVISMSRGYLGDWTAS